MNSTLIDPLIDPFGRTINYLRVSVTDRCDFRCLYCMSEHMTFLPKNQLLTLEELEILCTAFIKRGVRKLRLTGGEPLVRKNIMHLIANLSKHLQNATLQELTLTTNGSQLENFAKQLAEHGIKRINISLDTLNDKKFATITRWGKLSKVMAGIQAAQQAGLKIKINMVALKNINENEIAKMLIWSHKNNFDLTLIETMPMGEVETDRTENYLPLSQVQKNLQQQFTLTPLAYKTAGPARYFQVEQTGGRLGLITPLTHNFCENCNRVRLTCTGMLYMCLGQNDKADLRKVLREGKNINEAIEEAISRKPKGHDFIIEKNSIPAVARHMSVTGG